MLFVCLLPPMALHEKLSVLFTPSRKNADQEQRWQRGSICQLFPQSDRFPIFWLDAKTGQMDHHKVTTCTLSQSWLKHLEDDKVKPFLQLIGYIVAWRQASCRELMQPRLLRQRAMGSLRAKPSLALLVVQMQVFCTSVKRSGSVTKMYFLVVRFILLAVKNVLAILLLQAVTTCVLFSAYFLSLIHFSKHF